MMETALLGTAMFLLFVVGVYMTYSVVTNLYDDIKERKNGGKR